MIQLLVDEISVVLFSGGLKKSLKWASIIKVNLR